MTVLKDTCLLRVYSHHRSSMYCSSNKCGIDHQSICSNTIMFFKHNRSPLYDLNITTIILNISYIWTVDNVSLSLEEALRQPWLWSVSDFIFLATAVSSFHWQRAIIVLIKAELARGHRWNRNLEPNFCPGLTVLEFNYTKNQGSCLQSSISIHSYQVMIIMMNVKPLRSTATPLIIG